MAPHVCRIVYMGTAPLACAGLQALAAYPPVRVEAVVTRPDRPKGRKLQPQPSAVKRLAHQLGLPIHQPEKAGHEDFLALLQHLAPDLIVVAAYGQILPPSILTLPTHGCLNIHASLLPRYRGAAPIQWAILDGAAETGVTIMQMDAGLDTGPCLAQDRTAIGAEDTASTLEDRLAAMGAQLLVRCLPDYLSGKLIPQPQDAQGASYARKITKEDGRMDWRQPAATLCNRVRALNPWPGTFTTWNHDSSRRLLKIWKVSLGDPSPLASPGAILEASSHRVLVGCGAGSLELEEIQLEGGKRISAKAFVSGHPMRTGDRLGGPLEEKL